MTTSFIWFGGFMTQQHGIGHTGLKTKMENKSYMQHVDMNVNSWYKYELLVLFFDMQVLPCPGTIVCNWLNKKGLF